MFWSIKKNLFLLSLIFIAISSELFFSQTGVIRDALGHEYQLGPPPQRIISLAPNLTEILFELGLGDRIVGLTRFCNYPPQVAAIEKVGGYLDPSLEKIVALKPDLILAFRGTPLDVLNKIKSANLPLLVFDEGQKIEDLFLLIQTIGRITRRENQASQLIVNLQNRIQYIQNKIRKIKARPKVFLTLSPPGLWTCGHQSFLHHLIELAGGENIAAFESRRWFLLRTEDLLRASPDIIVILAPDLPTYMIKKNFFLQEKIFSQIKAVQYQRFGWLNEDEASRFGPRLVKALEDLARLLHPEIFN